MLKNKKLKNKYCVVNSVNIEWKMEHHIREEDKQ